MKKIARFGMAALLIGALSACGTKQEPAPAAGGTEERDIQQDDKTGFYQENPAGGEEDSMKTDLADGLVRIPGGTFLMGSPESEDWREADETRHEVTVSDFYMGQYEVTQAEYEQLMGSHDTVFSGENLPVENVTWYEAIAYCNARSEAEGLTPAYVIDGLNVAWDRGADGYRLPTEAEWEYACRGGTETPFNTETSISDKEANYFGHYPYQIEGNYFSQENLDTKPGEYRQTTTPVGSFGSNSLGLYDMHGNVGEWVWDYYGEYGTESQTNPSGPVSGSRRVNRGGGWNDFAKNLRSAYRSSAPPENASLSIGFRVARGTMEGVGTVANVPGSMSVNGTEHAKGSILIAYFSWSGNTRGIAQEIERQTGGTLFEIQCTTPYSSDYNTVLDQAQRDQHEQARPELSTHVEDMDDYDVIFLGYPNWWASIPMPIASFLEEYDFSGKTIIPFCSHGGGRFGQSLAAIAKLAPDTVIAEGLAVSYSGGSGLEQDIAQWLENNQIQSE